ncbi:MAG: hypothetical protein IJM30_01705 [Thermoguttaceae bacterium]|nr:hypothetical protein [Thermoguttaceae bacterium]
MTQLWNRGLLCVPLNEQGTEEYDYDLPEWPNVFFYTINGEQYDELESVFWEWNDTLGLLIGQYEEETLPAEKTREALEILERRMRERKDEPKFLETAEILKKVC